MDTTTVRDLLVLDPDEAAAAGVFFMEQASEAAVDFLSIASSAFVISSHNETMSVGIGGGNFNSSSGSFDNSVVTNVSSVRHLNPSVQVPYTATFSIIKINWTPIIPYTSMYRIIVVT